MEVKIQDSRNPAFAFSCMSATFASSTSLLDHVTFMGISGFLRLLLPPLPLDIDALGNAQLPRSILDFPELEIRIPE